MSDVLINSYRMPAEWEPHAAVWLAWPYDKIDFPQDIQAEKAQENFIQALKAIHTSERVELLVADEVTKRRVNQILQNVRVDLDKINFNVTGYFSYWMRDIGPLFVINHQTKELAMTKWVFNSWGNKYKEFLVDNDVPYKINRTLKLKMFEPGIVMEGGSIEVNGQGTLMTTEQCLLNKNRNPQLNKTDIEKYLSDYLGISHFIWLKKGIEGDDTDGHIDDIARFVSPNTVVCAYQDDAADPDHNILKSNFDILQNSTDQDGNKLNLIKLPTPGVVSDSSGRRLPASYANFYIGNKVILVPIFNKPNDQKAVEIIQSCFPDRKAVAIYAADLVFALGTFHCMTQQQPKS